jgi:hypothetical protein
MRSKRIKFMSFFQITAILLTPEHVNDFETVTFII